MCCTIDDMAWIDLSVVNMNMLRFSNTVFNLSNEILTKKSFLRDYYVSKKNWSSESKIIDEEFLLK